MSMHQDETVEQGESLEVLEEKVDPAPQSTTTELEATVTELKGQVEALQSALEEKTRSVAGLEEEMKQAKELSDLTVSEMQGEVEEMRNKLELREAELSTLQEEVTRLVRRPSFTDERLTEAALSRNWWRIESTKWKARLEACVKLCRLWQPNATTSSALLPLLTSVSSSARKLKSSKSIGSQGEVLHHESELQVLREALEQQRVDLVEAEKRREFAEAESKTARAATRELEVRPFFAFLTLLH
jgi:hypothetical protein